MADLEQSSFGDFRLGDWLVEPSLNRISRGDSTIPLELKVMQVLVCLAENAGDLVSRQQLTDTVWATEFISDNTVTHAITELRNALGDDAKSPTFIETIHRRGYRLVAPVVRDLRFEHVRQTVGAGVRFLVGRNGGNVRIDVAYGDQFRFYFRLDEAF